MLQNPYMFAKEVKLGQDGGGKAVLPAIWLADTLLC